VHSRENSAYRLDVAREALGFAEAEAKERRWPACLNYSQQAVESAGKSIVLHFRPIPRTHDVDELLDDLLASQVVSKAIESFLSANMDIFREMGMDTHIRAAYGDEDARMTPGALIQEAEAMSSLRKARRAVALAEEIFSEMTKPPSKK